MIYTHIRMLHNNKDKFKRISYVKNFKPFRAFINKASICKSSEFTDFIKDKNNDYVNRLHNVYKVKINSERYIKTYNHINRILENAKQWRLQPDRDISKDNDNLKLIIRFEEVIYESQVNIDKARKNIINCDKHIQYFSKKLRFTHTQKQVNINRLIESLTTKTQNNCVNILFRDNADITDIKLIEVKEYLYDMIDELYNIIVANI